MNSMFSPTFGFKPQIIVSRDAEIAHFTEGLTGAPGHPNRSTIFIGQRGMGKTVLLLELAECADNNGFIAIRVVAGGNMLTEIIEGLQLTGERLAANRKIPVKSINAGAFGFSVGLTFTEEIQKNYGFRTKLTLLCEALAKQGKGVLFLVDEIYADAPQIREFATTYQHIAGDGMNVAVAMAGLPNTTSSVLNDKTLTFLNRARKIYLAPLPLVDVSSCYAKVLRELNVEFDMKTLDEAALATKGYPYLFQLIGYNMLKLLEGSSRLTEEILDHVIINSKRALADDVFLPCLNPLSPEDKRFLSAMAKDADVSMVSDLRSRLRADKSFVQTYRKRLIDAGVIHSPSRGSLAFSIPYLGQYLRGEL